MYKNLVRQATEEELANYYLVNKLMLEWEDDYADKIIENIGHYVFALQEENKAAYQRVYRVAKKHGLTVAALVDRYCIEVD